MTHRLDSLRGRPWCCVAAVLGAALAAPVAGEERKAPKKPSEKVIKARQKAGFAFGWLGKDKAGRYNFDYEPDELEGALPAFGLSLGGGRLRRLPELPAPKGPFALDFSFQRVGAEAMRGLRRLPGLTSVELWGADVPPAGLKELGELRGLTRLGLASTKATDRELKAFAGLKRLTGLDLGLTEVTDAGLEHVSALKALSWLDLSDTKVTDAGLGRLAGLKRLTTLNLSGTGVTGSGLEGLVALTELDLGLTEADDEGLIWGLSEGGAPSAAGPAAGRLLPAASLGEAVAVGPSGG
jgi:internalin A